MKRIAVMQDLSCLGKCSLSVILPVISAMGVECAVLPTAVLSTHTAFPGPAVADLSDFAQKTIRHWAGLGAEFDGLLTGYLASEGQAALAGAFLSRFATPDNLLVVDPAMGDHGKLYSGLGEEMVGVMGTLCRRADLCIPNMTEAALLAGVPWRDTADPGFCGELAAGLIAQGCRSVMITGVQPRPGETGFYWTDGEESFCHGAPRIPRSCHGTGDIFAAVVTGALVKGKKPEQAGALACEFIRRSIHATGEDSRWGVAFEGELGWLAEEVG